MNIYQTIANELRVYCLACTAVHSLQNKHNRVEYPIWSIEHDINSEGLIMEHTYSLVVKEWVSLAAFNRWFDNISDLQEIIEIYTIICPKEDDRHDPECMLFISWIIRGSPTFRSMHDWEPFKHKFHKVSELEKIVDSVAALVVDSELFHTLLI